MSDVHELIIIKIKLHQQRKLHGRYNFLFQSIIAHKKSQLRVGFNILNSLNTDSSRY